MAGLPPTSSPQAYPESAPLNATRAHPLLHPLPSDGAAPPFRHECAEKCAGSSPSAAAVTLMASRTLSALNLRSRPVFLSVAVVASRPLLRRPAFGLLLLLPPLRLHGARPKTALGFLSPAWCTPEGRAWLLLRLLLRLLLPLLLLLLLLLLLPLLLLLRMLLLLLP